MLLGTSDTRPHRATQFWTWGATSLLAACLAGSTFKTPGCPSGPSHACCACRPGWVEGPIVGLQCGLAAFPFAVRTGARGAGQHQRNHLAFQDLEDERSKDEARVTLRTIDDHEAR